jgi:acetamidase/formamidase
LTVDRGESFIIEAEDASAGLIETETDTDRLARSPLRKHSPPKGNPLGGPVFVQDAEPGDLLEVEIETNRSRASGLRLLGAWDNPDQHRPALERIQPTINIIEHRPGPSGTARDGQAFLKGNYLWDLQPMIGCFGVAPEREVLTSSMGQSPAGGNLDIRDVKEGNGVGSYNFGSVSFNGSGDGAVGSGRRWPAVC